MNSDESSAREAAKRVLRSGRVGDRLAREEGEVMDPLVLHGPAGEHAGWVAGVVRGSRLLGFIQLERDGRFRRYVSLLSRFGTPDSCPEPDAWFDPDRVVRRAGELSADDERLGEPILTFDRNPDRIVWEIPAVSGSGERTFQVLGEHTAVKSNDAATG